jgi:RNA polymerase sigma factor (sigma-70 family)
VVGQALAAIIIERWKRGPDVESRHAADVELARLCERGDENAWERFIRAYRPILYRAAEALDPSGGAREIADSLYAELYGVRGGAGDARSLFRYFEGRSSLATWLRAVLAQRFVDHLRMRRRLQPLPEDDEAQSADESRHAMAAAEDPPAVDRPRYLALLHDALGRAIARLGGRDRLRLACYYVQELTLAETGRVLAEHEATVSRQLAKSRRALRESVERDLRESARLSEPEIAECFASVAADPGPLDLTHVFGAVTDGKEPAAGRST